MSEPTITQHIASHLRALPDEALIGMLDKKLLMSHVEQILTPGDFVKPEHRKVFTVITNYPSKVGVRVARGAAEPVNIYGTKCLVWEENGTWFGADEKSKRQKKKGIRVDGGSKSQVIGLLKMTIRALPAVEG